MKKSKHSPDVKGRNSQSDDSSYSFLNPYNFVKSWNRLNPKNTEGVAGDHAPTPHGGLAKNTISGWVDVTLSANSPLLLSDFRVAQKNAQSNSAKQGVRRVRTVRTAGDQGAPELLATSFKGALRSAYEAITNSRFGTLDEGHQYVCAERLAPEDLKDLEPGILIKDEATGKLMLQVLKGIKVGGKELKCSAKIKNDPKPDGFDPKEPQRLYYALVTKKKDFFQVNWVFNSPDTMSKELKNDPAKYEGFTHRAVGYFHWTDGQFGTPGKQQKENEHFFITGLIARNAEPYTVDSSVVNSFTAKLNDDLRTGWNSVIYSYGKAHENQEDTQGLATYITHPELWELKENRTVWVRVVKNKPEALYPSMIGRRTFEASPKSLIELSHHAPPSRLQEFSAADRVFGWVGKEIDHDKPVNAYKGCLNFSPPKCAGGHDSVVRFAQPLPLSILSGAHPSQWRFYANGDYAKDETIRGRKFFIPHRLAMNTDNYWPSKQQAKLSVEDSQVNIGKPERSCYREYISPKEPDIDDKVHTWIDSWVRPGTEFTIRIHLNNVEREDAAALIWLLDLSNNKPPKAKLNPQIGIGFGKPLGFGSMSMVIADSCLVETSDFRNRYSSLASAVQGLGTSRGSISPKELIDNFETICKDLTTLLVLPKNDFLAISTGWEELPVHYPRESEIPVQEGYEWFTENKKADNPQVLPEPKKISAPILKTHD